jgi:hypothetical protein
MAPFRRVTDSRAGPEALGILVPPGQRTLVILRPRALRWDLLPVRPGARLAWPPVFCAFDRDEAASVARQIQQDLEQGARGSANPVAVVASPTGLGFLVCCQRSDLRWIACLRLPGQPYEPAIFATLDEAAAAADALARFLWPNADAQQEYYFNTQNFERPVQRP